MRVIWLCVLRGEVTRSGLNIGPARNLLRSQTAVNDFVHDTILYMTRLNISHQLAALANHLEQSVPNPTDAVGGVFRLNLNPIAREDQSHRQSVDCSHEGCLL